MSMLDNPFDLRTVSVDVTFLVRQALAAEADGPANSIGMPGASHSDPGLRDGAARATG